MNLYVFDTLGSRCEIPHTQDVRPVLLRTHGLCAFNTTHSRRIRGYDTLILHTLGVTCLRYINPMIAAIPRDICCSSVLEHYKLSATMPKRSQPLLYKRFSLKKNIPKIGGSFANYSSTSNISVIGSVIHLTRSTANIYFAVLIQGTALHERISLKTCLKMAQRARIANPQKGTRDASIRARIALTQKRLARCTICEGAQVLCIRLKLIYPSERRS